MQGGQWPWAKWGAHSPLPARGTWLRGQVWVSWSSRAAAEPGGHSCTFFISRYSQVLVLPLRRLGIQQKRVGYLFACLRASGCRRALGRAAVFQAAAFQGQVACSGCLVQAG